MPTQYLRLNHCPDVDRSRCPNTPIYTACSSDWVGKLKQDMLRANADIGVLVTSVYPAGMERMGFVDSVWVCSLDEFKGSVSLLRQSLITTQKAVQKEDNKADKMSLLYSYLTGNEFAMQLGTIVDGFIVMQEELEKEKRSLMASWKRRQKLIDEYHRDVRFTPRYRWKCYIAY
jgi:hypothetical protein